MAGRPKLGSESDIANKLSKSKKAVDLQRERPSVGVAASASSVTALLVEASSVGVAASVTASLVEASSIGVAAGETASIFRPAVEDLNPAPILLADPVMDGRSRVLTIQQLNDVNSALKKVKECSKENWPFANSWFFPPSGHLPAASILLAVTILQTLVYQQWRRAVVS